VELTGDPTLTFSGYTTLSQAWLSAPFF